MTETIVSQAICEVNNNSPKISIDLASAESEPIVFIRCAPFWHSFEEPAEMREFLAKQARRRRRPQREATIRAALRQAVRVLRAHEMSIVQKRPVYAARASARSSPAQENDGGAM